MKKLFFMAMCVVLLLQAYSKDVYVNINATLRETGESWDHGYRTIKLALDEAEEHDTVYISGDLYNEVQIQSKRYLTIIGTVDDNGTPLTVISSENQSGLEAVALDDNNHISNIHFKDSWYGLDATDDYNVTITDCLFSNNQYGIWLQYTKAVIKNCNFSDNKLQAVFGQLDYSDIHSNTFTNHTGSALRFVDSSKTKIHHNSFSNNQISMESEGSQCCFYGNMVTGSSSNGGIYLHTADEAQVYENQFDNNETALRLVQDNSTIYNNSFSNNELAINIKNGSEAQIVRGNGFADNEMSILSEGGTNATIDGNVFAHNLNDFHFIDSDNTVRNNTIHSNYGYVVIIEGNQNAIYNNLMYSNRQLFKITNASASIFNNTCVEYRMAVEITSMNLGISLNIMNNIFWNQTLPSVYNMDWTTEVAISSLFISNNCYHYNVPNIDLNPITESLNTPFEAEDSYKLHANSNCIDKGLDALPLEYPILTDMNGYERYSLVNMSGIGATGDLTGQVSLIDLGACEYRSSKIPFETGPAAKTPVDWSFSTESSLSGLHHITANSVKDGIIEYSTYFPTYDYRYDPYVMLSMNGNIIDTDIFKIFFIKIYSPIERDQSFQISWVDEDGLLTPSVKMHLDSGWNYKIINMDVLAAGYWGGKKVQALRFDFDFTDLVNRSPVTSDEDFIFDFKMDWVKLYPDQDYTGVEKTGWTIYK